MQSTVPIVSVLVVLVVLLAACTGAAPSGSGAETPAPYTPAEYKGPEVAARIADAELDLAIQVGTGGHVLELIETGRREGHTFVKIKLTAPGAGEAVTQAVETKALRVPLVAESGPVHVKLQQVQRGAHYFVEPVFELCKVIPR